MESSIQSYEPLFGSWHVAELIGQGSFGTVYRVCKEEMGERYESAVKLISIPNADQLREAEAAVGSDPESLNAYFEGYIRDIVKEVKLLHSLNGNPNIVGYFDHAVIKQGSGAGWDLLIRMEYLASLIKTMKERRLSRGQVARLGVDICSALEACARKGVIHRDIKDENIFVSADGVFKLGDFGIARDVSFGGKAASRRGTPLYMAPEIAQGGSYDALVDVYSLGLVLYRLLNHARMPFMPPWPEKMLFKDSDEALARRMRGEELPAPSLAGESLGRVILKACAYQPAHRYGSASEMKRELETVLAAMPPAERDEPVTPSFRFQGAEPSGPAGQTLAAQPPAPAPEFRAAEVAAKPPAAEAESATLRHMPQALDSLYRLQGSAKTGVEKTGTYGRTESAWQTNTWQKEAARPRRNGAKNAVWIAVLAIGLTLAAVFLFTSREDLSAFVSRIFPQPATAPAAATAGHTHAASDPQTFPPEATGAPAATADGQALRDEAVAAALSDADAAYQGANYVQAFRILQDALERYPGDSGITSRIGDYEAQCVPVVVEQSARDRANGLYNESEEPLEQLLAYLPGNTLLRDTLDQYKSQIVQVSLNDKRWVRGDNLMINQMHEDFTFWPTKDAKFNKKHMRDYTGKAYPRGIYIGQNFEHISYEYTSDLTYVINGQFKRLTGTFAMEYACQGPQYSEYGNYAMLEVYGDDVPLWSSPRCNGTTDPVVVNVDIPQGVQRLKLVYTSYTVDACLFDFNLSR